MIAIEIKITDEFIAVCGDTENSSPIKPVIPIQNSHS